MINVGDIVRYLNAVGGGRVVRIADNMAYVDEDGFETPVLLKECVVVTPAQPKANAESKYVAPKQPKAAPAPAKAAAPAPEETPGGDSLNIVLAYEPEDIKHLTTTEYDAYLVNDSNYWLQVNYLTRADGHDWVMRFAGTIEPGFQEHLGHVTRDMIGDIDRVAIQYVAFKRDREFKLKAAVTVEYAIDNTKFFKLHSFHDNVYFDTPVLAFDIVRNDTPHRMTIIDSGNLEEAMRRKRAADAPKGRPVAQPRRHSDIIEADLHINALLDNTAGLDNAAMLEVQLAEFNRVMRENLSRRGQKIVFIHGKGEGVLRNALLKELKLRYKTCDVQDASFREYGFGATQVTIK